MDCTRARRLAWRFPFFAGWEGGGGFGVCVFVVVGGGFVGCTGELLPDSSNLGGKIGRSRCRGRDRIGCRC